MPFLPLEGGCGGGTLQPSRGGPRGPELPALRRAEPGAPTPHPPAGRRPGWAHRSRPGPEAAPAGAPLAQVGAAGQVSAPLPSAAGRGEGGEGECGGAARGFEISDSCLE